MTEIMLLVGVVCLLGGGVVFLSWLVWGSRYFDEGRGYTPICGFCMREIPATETAREIQCGGRFEHLGFACARCLDKADRLKQIQNEEK